MVEVLEKFCRVKGRGRVMGGRGQRRGKGACSGEEGSGGEEAEGEAEEGMVVSPSDEGE